MNKLLFLTLSAAFAFASCSEENSNEALKVWEGQYTYDDISFDNGNFTVEFESEDWELTGQIFLESETLASSDIYDYFTEYVTYKAGDTEENIPFPLTDSRMALTYGTIDGSSTEEIIAANGCDIAITKSSATELYLNFRSYKFIGAPRSISIEVNYEGELRYIVVNQTQTRAEYNELGMAGGVYISTIKYSTLNLTFGSEGGSYTLKLISGGTHTLPDTVGKVGSIFLYTKSLYDGTEYYDNCIWGDPYYPSTEEYSEPLELTYGYVGDSTTEEVVGIYSSEYGISIEKIAESEFEITVEPNTSGSAKWIYFNILSDWGSGATPQAYYFSQLAE